MSTDVATLMEMGFPENQAARALAKTNYKGVQVAMDWLFAHADDPDINDPFEMPAGNVLGSSKPDEAAQTTENSETNTGTAEGAEAGDGAVEQAKSLRCDECGKLLKSEIDAQAHAARTQHASFSESTEEIKPLTAEEKAQQALRLQEKLKQRRQEKEEIEKKEKIAKEKMRRTTGKDIISAKAKMEEEEIKKIAEERRREKLEEKRARQRVKEEIEKDRKERAARNKKPTETSPVTQAASAAQPSSSQTAPPKDYSQCRLQIRLTNGEAITQSFSSKEPLAAVRLYIEMNRTDGSGPFNLMTNFPKKVFTAEDMEKPLTELGLVPSAVIMLTKAQ